MIMINNIINTTTTTKNKNNNNNISCRQWSLVFKSKSSKSQKYNNSQTNMLKTWSGTEEEPNSIILHGTVAVRYYDCFLFPSDYNFIHFTYVCWSLAWKLHGESWGKQMGIEEKKLFQVSLLWDNNLWWAAGSKRGPWHTTRSCGWMGTENMLLCDTLDCHIPSTPLLPSFVYSWILKS